MKGRNSIFVSYSHLDVIYLRELRVHLKPLELWNDLIWWDDTRIAAGDDWRNEIKIALDQARVAVLLVSDHFLASDFIAKNELPPLLESAASDDVSILPVILRPSLFHRIKQLAKFQAINKPSEPLAELEEIARQKVWVALAERILDSFEEDGMVSLKEPSSPISRPELKSSQTNPEEERRSPPSPPSDLEIRVSTGAESGALTLTYNLVSPSGAVPVHYALFGPVVIKREPGSYIEEQLNAIQKAGFGSGDDLSSRRRLEALGTDLLNSLLPEELVSLLGGLTSSGYSIQVVSDEAWIPWEFLRVESENGSVFLGEVFAISRWLPGSSRPPSEFHLRECALVGLEEGTDVYIAQEVEQISRLLSAQGRKFNRIHADYLAVTDALASGRFDLWHFATHGRSPIARPDEASILLEDKELRPFDLSGDARKFSQTKPLIFLSGPTVHSWAHKFVLGGAGAIVGAYWTPSSKSSQAFAIAFYRSLLAGEPLGVATRKARLEARDSQPGDPSWLSFVAFGNPLARVKGISGDS